MSTELVLHVACTPAAAAIFGTWPDSTRFSLRAYGGMRETATCLQHLLIAPRLHFVRRCGIGRVPTRTEDIDPLDGMLFREWYGSRAPSVAASEASTRILRKSAQEKLYIACNCRPDAAGSPPVTGTHELKVGMGNYTAVRLTARTRHAWFCFQRFESMPHAESEDNVAQPKSAPDLLNGHIKGVPTDRKPAPGPMSIRPGDRGERDTTVFGALMHMLTAAGRHKITAKRTHRGELAAVALAVRAMLHRKVMTLSVADCMLINPPDPASPTLLTELFSRTAGMWPKNQMPVGWVLVIASDLVKHADGSCTLTVHRLLGWTRVKGKPPQPMFTKSTVNFGCPVKVAEMAGTGRRAPYLVLLRAELSAEGTPLWIEGFAQPIVSRDCWVPIPSIAEREAVGALRVVAAELDTAGIEHDIEKKVGIMKNDDGETCEPDFVARKPEAQHSTPPLLMETQRTKSAEYEAAKVKPHRIMEDIGLLYVDDRRKFSRAVADTKLRIRLRKFFGLGDDGGPVNPPEGA